MRILILTDEPWNDKINGNNVMTNWFQGFDAEFANIYCSPGLPDNTICHRYFQITDSMMARSIMTGRKAGHEIRLENSMEEDEVESPEQMNTSFYGTMKKITTNPLRLIREWIWLAGRYDIEKLEAFINGFQPDVVFSIRMGTMKILRLERIIHGIISCRFFAFIGDDEYSLRQFSLSPAFWIRRFGIRRMLRENVKFYNIYYCQTDEQARYYRSNFPCRISTLNKCGDFSYPLQDHTDHKPIILIYAGKLYCNRWKVLGHVANAIRKVNQTSPFFQLHIYTKDGLTPKQNRLLNDGIHSIVKGAVSQEELKSIYNKADIALHVESNDIKNRLATRLSFSTKIMDCLSSGCAVMAFCWPEQAGYKYLHDTQSAFCVSNEEDLILVLEKIREQPDLINQYAARAKNLGNTHHQRKAVQDMLNRDFQRSN